MQDSSLPFCRCGRLKQGGCAKFGPDAFCQELHAGTTGYRQSYLPALVPRSAVSTGMDPVGKGEDSPTRMWESLDFRWATWSQGLLGTGGLEDGRHSWSLAEWELSDEQKPSPFPGILLRMVMETEQTPYSLTPVCLPPWPHLHPDTFLWGWAPLPPLLTVTYSRWDPETFNKIVANRKLSVCPEFRHSGSRS